jgi:hypothetical protein
VKRSFLIAVFLTATLPLAGWLDFAARGMFGIRLRTGTPPVRSSLTSPTYALLEFILKAISSRSGGDDGAISIGTDPLEDIPDIAIYPGGNYSGILNVDCLSSSACHNNEIHASSILIFQGTHRTTALPPREVVFTQEIPVISKVRPAV